MFAEKFCPCPSAFPAIRDLGKNIGIERILPAVRQNDRQNFTKDRNPELLAVRRNFQISGIFSRLCIRRIDQQPELL